MTCVGLVQVERGQPAEEQQGGQGGRQPGPGVQPPQGNHHHHQLVTQSGNEITPPCTALESAENKNHKKLKQFQWRKDPQKSFYIPNDLKAID